MFVSVLLAVVVDGFYLHQSQMRPSFAVCGVPPRSPRPEMYYDEEKIQRGLEKQLNEKYDPEYDEDIVWATKRLLELRLRRDQRLPVKTHEFKLLRRHIARLKQQKRLDELRAMGHDPLKRKPRTRRERQRAMKAAREKEKRRAKNRARLLGKQQQQKTKVQASDASHH